jgi:SAM-dependent methyltransferase
LQVANRRQDDLAAVRRRLRTLGYTETAVAQTLQIEGPYAVGPVGREIWHRYHLSGDDPLQVVIRVFLLGYPEDESRILELFGWDELAALLDVGLLMKVAPTQVASPVSLYPIADLYVATDWRWDEDASTRWASMRVMPLGRDSYGLARLAASSAGGQAVDLCSGSGVVALVVARNVDHVIGVDINPRAVNFARFNALFNSIGNCTFRQGDLYDGVERQQFHLATANPPFVPTPDVDTLLFRGGGGSGEDVLRRIIGGCADHLSDGGMCLIVTDLVQHAGIGYADKLADWLGGDSGLTGVVFKTPSMTPLEYAIEHTHATRRASEELFGWIDHYRAQAIDAIARGYIAIRKTGTQPCTTVTVPIAQLLEHPVPDSFLMGIFSRAEAAEDDLLDHALVSTYELGQVELVRDGAELYGRRLPYLVATRLTALEAEHGTVSLRLLLEDLRERGYQLGPERRAELEEAIRGLVIAGYLEPVGDHPEADASRTRRHRQAALQLWWSR